MIIRLGHKRSVIHILLTLLVLVFFTSASGQSIKRDVMPAAGSYSSSVVGSLSWTLGEPCIQTFSSGGKILTQGFQQPDANKVSIDITLFVQGFYSGSGMLRPTVNPVSYPFLSDTITVELAGAESPYSVIQSKKVLLSTSGHSNVLFPGVVQGHPYYICIKHRNSVETWSSAPVSLALPKTFYDFSSTASAAYGNNLADMGDGRYAIWSGDVDQNGSIDSLDNSQMEISIPLFITGYVTEDLSGDGIVESSDFSLLENNIELLINAIKP